MERQSKLRLYSLGVVVESKPPGTDYILVSPVEELSLQESGLIKEQTHTFTGVKPNTQGSQFNTEHESKNYVRAKWVDISGGNRTTAPDVVSNETVLLLKYANVDEYFWCDFGREPLLRRLEDVLYSYSNLPTGVKAYDKKTSYWVHVSTRDKFVHLHTADNDGEFTTYDVRIDTKNGRLDIKDGVGNLIELDSAQGRITEIATQEIVRKAPKITDICQTYAVKSSDITLSASSITQDAPLVTHTGNVVTKGSCKANPHI